MQVNPYLHYDGNCEAAFKFYEKAAGGKIEVMMTHESAPPDMPMPPDWKKKILHARITFDGHILMGSDSPPDHFRQPQGFSVTLHVDDHRRGREEIHGACAKAARSTWPSRRPSSPRDSACASTSSGFRGW